MTNKTATILGVVLLLSWSALIYTMLSKTTEKVDAHQASIPKTYVEIGNGIRRTNDLEMGVVCYTKSNSSLSCVKVSQ